MPSRSNPNTPSSLKPKTANVLKSKRKHNQRLARSKIIKSTPRTSQALRQAAPLSKKKAKKLEKKFGHARRRALEAGELEMTDGHDGEAGKRKGAVASREESAMDVDQAVQ